MVTTSSVRKPENTDILLKRKNALVSLFDMGAFSFEAMIFVGMLIVVNFPLLKSIFRIIDSE